jgi:hypothetical protein
MIAPSPDLATFAASLLPGERDAGPASLARIEAVALLHCAVVLLERGRMLTAEQREIDAELHEIGERLQRLRQQ